MSGPLAGIRMLEIAGIGPGPFCAMLLADLGADVLRVDRAGNVQSPALEKPSGDFLNRGRRSIGLDLKHPQGKAALLQLAARADVLMEGFRPGVMERLGVGPAECAAANPRLIYARMTGWGQSGPLAHAAGHDINYIALSGALAHIGRAGGAPVPPLNLVGDFGGGGLMQAFGICAALVERQSSGRGQVIDTAMTDGSATLSTMLHSFIGSGMWRAARGTNLLDTGAHFYDVYECADGNYISIGSIEPQFYAELLQRTGLAEEDWPAQMQREEWPRLKQQLAARFKQKTRAEWCKIMEGSDVCFAPVLTVPEAYEHPHNQARQTFVEVAGALQPAPAPRFSRTPGAVQGPPPHPGQHTQEGLQAWGFAEAEIAALREAGAVA